jgi:hypothetical protein
MIDPDIIQAIDDDLMNFVEFNKKQELVGRGEGDEVNFIKENALTADQTQNIWQKQLEFRF